MEAIAEETVASSARPSHEETPVLKEQVVRELVERLRRGDSVTALAAEYGVDRKTVRAWRDRGGYQPRAARPAVSTIV